ncbi:hypothetical protein OUY22_06555 [Nonomuraea sp. MCN248]|uniref:DUF3558 domain-containing protein n=1 Tax=Nonomuraea corallina TaxID=2989783 RepID=A0ABT4S796_9ACTN|nr:hypothetical protein [Nonomuraea corallina]MDA0633076.1 hypothetical protein [Nonomuraea corallina]
MRIQPSVGFGLAVLVLAAACSSPSPVLPDTRALGDVTAAPQECGLISANAIKIATGLDHYAAYGTKRDMGRRFASCSVREEGVSDSSLGLIIEVFEPSPISQEGLENTKRSARGTDLPAELRPGFVARRKNAKDKTVAFVYGWTSDYKRLLMINIIENAPGRDSVADATEFFRQLKPLLLDRAT